MTPRPLRYWFIAMFVGLVCLGVGGCSEDLAVEDRRFSCASDDDCLPGFSCVADPAGGELVCGPTLPTASCDDGSQNGAETGIDCGGPECPACLPATCSDATMGQQETATDCGGPECEACDSGLGCQLPRDCKSGICTDQLCAEPRCDDGIANGLETGTDCGGASACGPCPLGEGCAADDDCAEGTCSSGALCLQAIPLALSDFVACAALEGNVRCWGVAFEGRLGLQRNGILGDDELPWTVPPIALGRPAVQVAVGSAHACALLDNGEVRCWGNGLNGELGVEPPRIVGDDEAVTTVAPVNLGEPAIQVAAGSSHTCALLRSGTVRCWGLGSDGQLGTGSGQSVTDPFNASAVDLGASRRAVALALGQAHSCALLDDGTIRCWGSGDSGRLGVGSTDPIGLDRPVSASPVVDLGDGAAAIGAGRTHTCAVLASDRRQLKCWGAGFGSPLGYVGGDDIGDEARELGDARALELAFEIDIIAGGAIHTCAMGMAGQVVCWGTGVNGALGTAGEFIAPADSAPLVDIGGAASFLAAGTTTNCALRSDGAVVCWGFSGFGLTALGSTDDTGDPPLATAGIRCREDRECDSGSCDAQGTCIAPSCSDEVTDGLETGQDCGGGVCAPCPADAACGWPADCESQVCSSGGSCAAESCFDGTSNGDETGVDCGGSECGPCADRQRCEGPADCLGGSCLEGICQPADCQSAACGSSCARCHVGERCSFAEDCRRGSCVEGICRSITRIVAGADHTCVVHSIGELTCWGSNQFGQIGAGHSDDVIGDDETPTHPSAQARIGGFAQILVAGIDHTCAVMENFEPAGIKTLRCWGKGADHRFGFASDDVGRTKLPSENHALVFGDDEIVDVAAGETHTCVLFDSGKVSCLGTGDDGELGYGTDTLHGEGQGSLDLRVNLGSAIVTSICAGRDHTCALTTTGSLYCWGKGARGRLGRANTESVGINRLPLDAGSVELGGEQVTDVVCGEQHTCVRLRGGAVRCWGANDLGQLGLGHTRDIGDDELPTATATVALGGPAEAIFSGPAAQHTCALLTDGRFRCWGPNPCGRLGTASQASVGDDEPVAAGPTVSLPPQRKVWQAALGSQHTCVLLDDESVYCFGAAGLGQGQNIPPGCVGDDAGEVPVAVDLPE